MIRHEEKGIVWYESELINAHGVRHGFFGRAGGVSEAPFDSLNVKLQEGDSPDNVIENRRRAMDTLELQDLSLHFTDLSHGSNLRIVRNTEGSLSYPQTDALATGSKTQALMLSVADCLPIILAGKGKFVAIVHAGWRGLDSGIISKALKQCADEYGAMTSEVAAAIGPAIGQKHYPVGPEVANKFAKYEGAVLEQASGYYLDLVNVARQQLKKGGIIEVDTSSLDVFADKEFFSWRRQQPTGRNAVIAALDGN